MNRLALSEPFGKAQDRLREFALPPEACFQLI
jgi:hypothetical protein